MRILISGASGFVGAPLCSFLRAQGHDVVALTHSHGMQGSVIRWDPENKEATLQQFEGFDAVIHLAGESLFSFRWTKAKKEKIYRSRVQGTRFLCEILASLASSPKVLIVASAVGIYGDRGEELLDEESSLGSNFLSTVCKDWESASAAAEKRGIRVVKTRFGVVIDAQGGIVKKLLPLYKAGLGARLGSGKQWMSWVALQDLIHALNYILKADIKGALNVVSPHPVRQAEFAKSLAYSVRRFVVLRVPAFFLRWMCGDLADALLLSSACVVPTKLLDSGFTFQYPLLAEALKR